MGTRTIIVTGGNGSLGSRTAEVLAADPQTRVVMTGRRLEETKARAEAVNRLYGREAVAVLPLDLASLDSVRSFARQFAEAGAPCDALVANAGVQSVGDKWSADGFELTFAVNHLGNFALANLLLPHCSPSARLVVVASGAHDPENRLSRATDMPAPVLATVAEMAKPEQAEPDPPQSRKLAAETGRRRYTTSKLCNVLFVRELAARLLAQESAITVNAFDPGLMPGTGLARDGSRAERFIWRYLLPAAIPFVPGVHTPTASARNLVRLATDPDLNGATGAYFVGKKRKAPSFEARDREKGKVLWEQTMELLSERAPEIAERITA